MTKNTLLPLLLIPLLAFLIVQASKNTLAAIHLSNASYQLQSLIQQTNLEQISKAQSALKKVQSLSPNDPAYLNLQANAQLWQAYLKQADDKQKATLQSAQALYQKALKKQPNSPYLWSSLAKTDQAQVKKMSTLNAMQQANYYAPSDHTILSNSVLWTLPQWQQLNQQQKQTSVEQLKRLLKHRNTNQQLLKQLKSQIKTTGQTAVICSKLPRDNKFKQICR